MTDGAEGGTRRTDAMEECQHSRGGSAICMALGQVYTGGQHVGLEGVVGGGVAMAIAGNTTTLVIWAQGGGGG